MNMNKLIAVAAVAATVMPSPSFADDPEEPVVEPDVWAEVTYDDIPTEVSTRLGSLIPLDAVSYVQTGLMGHFDAIRNAGLNLPQDMTATEWKNLVPGYPDAEFISTAGHWRNGYSFCFTGEGIGGCARLKSKLNTGSNIMVQLAVTVDYTKQRTGSGAYPIFFHDGVNELSLFFNNTSKRTQTLYLKADKFGAGSNNRPTINTWDGRYATFILHTNQQLIVENGSSVKSRTATPTISAFNYQFSWFSSYYANSTPSDNGEAAGDCHAVRIYNVELTPEEIAWNRMLDEVRYRGVETNVNVSVWSDAAGVEGNEANGKYMVNGQHVFTAPASVTASGCTYALAGYTLEVWDSAKNAWGAAETHAGESSFAYTNCIARAKVRLTWNWNMTSGAKPLDADAYVQRGLVLNFDGIRNAGFGVPHNPDATDWANLGSHGGAGIAERTFLDSTYWHAKSADGYWDDDGYQFRNRNYFAFTNKFDLGFESTAQVVADYDFAASKPFASSSGIRWPAFFGVLDGGNVFNMYVNIQDNSIVDNVYSYAPGNKRANTTDWDGRFINRIYDSTTGNKVSLITSCGPSCKTGTVAIAANTTTGRYTLAIGTDGNGTAAGTGYQAHIMNGKICAARLYDRILSADEMAYNRAIDEARFFGRFANLDAMDAVLVRSESPDGKVKLDDEGAYIIRNASKSFIAPASLVSGDKTYTCTGYRIESWNATTRQWNTDTTGSGLMVELSSTASGAANRRLTWLWSLSMAGLRAASDYTAFDYVQGGLMGNFDGICNYGAAHPHNTYARRWRNLVPDQPDATFNTANGSWTGDAFNFTGNVHASVESPGIDVGGSNLSIQLATVVDWTMQPFGSGYYAIFFGNNNNNDTDIFFNNTSTSTNNNTLRFNADPLGTKIGGKDYRPTLTWEGQYATAILGDGVSYLLQGTTLTGGKTRTNTTIPARNFTWGGQTSSAKAYAKGKFHSVRIYNKALTEAEIVHNRRVDDIRFRGIGDVTVVNGAIGVTAANGASSVADGVYNLDSGTVTITAPVMNEGGHTYRPQLLVETYNAATGEWTANTAKPVWMESYTVDKSAIGNFRIRLTWTWQIRKGFMLIVK